MTPGPAPDPVPLAVTTTRPPADRAEETRSGQAVVILHGLFGAARNWGAIARRLAAAGHLVHALDLRNHGASPWAERMDYPALAADVAAALDALDLEAPVVLGHSMGGKAALHLALTRPDRPGALVIADIAPALSPGAEGMAPLIAAMADLPLETIARRADAEAALARAGVPPSLCRFLAQNLEHHPADPRRPPAAPSTSGQAWHWRLNLAVLARALPTLADFPDPPAGAVYPGPALILRGGDSSYVTDAHRPLFRRWLPAGRIVTLKGAGHWLHADQPDAFAASLLAFLARLPAP